MAEEGLVHELCLQGRQTLTLSGVTEVVSFEEAAVVLNTCMGTLIVQGRELQLKLLSLEGGRVVVEGHVSALVYEEPRASGGWLRRLLG